MEDKRIVELLFSRDDKALTECKLKYEKYMSYIADGILKNKEDTEECIADSYLSVWNSIPPNNPNNLKLYIGKTVRNAALNIYRKHSTKKRGGAVYNIALEELSECVSGETNVENQVEFNEIARSLNRFLETLDEKNRKIFLQRYWYMCPLKKIAKLHSMSESAIKSSLSRTRMKLKDHLIKEGVEL